MPKLKRDDVADLDIEALDAAEYDDTEFESYDGEVPPVGTVLRGYLKSMWWTRSAEKSDGTGDNPMIKALWVAAENDGDEEEYNGCPFWMNLPLIESVKFRWAPFMDAFGMSIRDFKGGSKVYVTGEETQNGAPIERVADFRPGEESDAAWCRVVTGREPYNGVWQARVKEWLPWDDAEDGDDGEPEEPEDLYNEDGDLVNEDGHLINEDGELINEDGDLVDEDDNVIGEEPETEPERPARGSRRSAPARSAQKPAAASSRTPSRPARSSSARPAAASSARSGRSSTRSAPARSAPKAGTKPAGRGRGRSSRPADDDPPF